MLGKRITKLESAPEKPQATLSNDEVKRDFEFSITRTCEVVIIGLSTDLLKDKTDTLTKIATYLDIEFAPWHLAQTREFIKPNNSGVTLFVRFISPFFRAIWLKAKKAKGNAKCSDIFIGQSDNLIYINERQSRKERLALLEARKVCKSLGFSSCWMTDGKILFKKTPEGRVLEYRPNLMSPEIVDMDTSHDLPQTLNTLNAKSTTTKSNSVNKMRNNSVTPTAPPATAQPSATNQPTLDHGTLSF